jgi:hypothetical protein
MLRNVRRPRNHLAPNFNNTDAIRDRLVLEIADLNGKLDGVDIIQSQENLSTAQSFKEMIHSRQQMLGNLSRQKSERSSFGLEKRLQ